MISNAVYLLCGVTSLACAVLLIRGWNRSQTSLLMWAALGFATFALGNLLLVVDLIVLPTEVSLYIARSVVTLIGFGLLIFGLTREHA